MQRVPGIAEVLLHAAQPHRLAAWYARHLGVHPARDERAGQQSETVRATPPDPAPTRADSPFRLVAAHPESVGDGWAITFVVADLDAMLTQLHADGVDVDATSEDSDGSCAWLRDPEDNPIVLRQADQSSASVDSADDVAVHVISDEPRQRVASGTAPRSRTGWTIGGALLVAVVVLIVFAFVGGDGKSDQSAEPPLTEGPTSSARPDESVSDQDTVRVTELGHSLLGISAGWELFASGTSGVVRIQFARGRITRTAVPALGTAAPVRLAVGPERVLLKPDDTASGYVVPDGQPARALRLGKRFTGPIFPGPEPGQFWISTGSRLQPRLSLIGADGTPTGVVVSYEANEFKPLVGDGRGNVLFHGIGGLYLASPDGMRKVAGGILLAVGADHLLTLRCDGSARCSRTVVNRDTGQRHVVQARCPNCDYPIGAISPDGGLAAVVRPASTYRSSLRIIDLNTGEIRSLTQMRSPYQAGVVAWSPDGQWLFVASKGQLLAFDTRTWQPHRLDVELPPVTQVAIRGAKPYGG